jgi:hypothetical protein
VSDIVSFRPTPEEAALIERAAKALQSKSKADAIRYLIRLGSERAGPLNQDPVWRFRLPKKYRLGRSLTNEEIDQELYGGRP